jgi:hypothetical protein
MKPPSPKTLKKADDIAKMNWIGNAYHDHKNFKECERFILTTKDVKQQKRALFLMGKLGMGMMQRVTTADLNSFIEQCS